MKRFALLGQQISESLSPRLHHHAWSTAGTPARYELWSCDLSGFDAAIERARCELAGFNLTAPFKRHVIPHLDDQTQRALALGSVNTVRVEGRRLIGENTDIVGVRSTLAMMPKRRGPALVLGAGGVLSSVVTGLVEAGFGPINVCARNRPSLDALDLPINRVAFEQRHELLGDQVLVVNATPLGGSERDPLPLESARVGGPSHWDLVYRVQGTTPWVDSARKNGIFALDGRLMLCEQAIESQRFWGLDIRGAESMRALWSFE